MATFCRLSILILVSFLPLLSFAEKPITPTKELMIEANDKVYDPTVLSTDSLKIYEKNFNFDWNDLSTLQVNKQKIAEIEHFFKTNPDIKKLTTMAQYAYGKLIFKLATYELHVLRNIDNSLKYFQVASAYLTSKEEKAWITAHLSYAYQLNYAITQNDKNKVSALKFIETVEKQNDLISQSGIAGFLALVKGKLEAVSKNFGIAENYLKSSLNIYQKTKAPKDDIYRRTQNHLANVLLDQGNKNIEALTLLKEVNQYWINKKLINNNPFAARNMMLLGEAYLKTNQDKLGIANLEKGTSIIQTIYGENSKELIRPYQLLTTYYFLNGKIKISKDYQEKLSKILNEKKQYVRNFIGDQHPIV